MSELKRELYNLCRNHITERLTTLHKSIADIQEAINNETKSSAGDKYETAREMLEQDIDLNIVQVNELSRQKEILDKINPAVKGEVVVPGSLVKTSLGNYFIAISAGTLKLNGDIYYAISALSPIGSKLMGQKPKSKIRFNDKEIVIQEIA